MLFFFFKQKTAYEMRISDWSSDVCSSNLLAKDLNARVLSNDFNLNKVAQLRGVDVININDLSNALKPVVLPGEKMHLRIVKAGEEIGRASCRERVCQYV